MALRTYQHVMRRLLNPILWLILAGLLAALLPPFLHPLWARLSILEHFAWQLCWGSLLCCLLALSLRAWFPAACAATLVIWWGMVVAPFVLSPYRDHPAETANGKQLRVLSLNLFDHSITSEATVRFLKGAGADVIGLVEVTPFWMTALLPVADDYPYRIGCTQPEKTCDVLLLSKRPLLQSAWTAATPHLPSLAWGRIDAGGRQIVIVETHLAWPFSRSMRPQLATGDGDPIPPPSLAGVPRLKQGEQAAGLAEYLKPLGPDLVMMGDFNSAPWSRLQQALRDTAGLRNASGLTLTWPSWTNPLFRLPIDHLFLRGAISAQSLMAGPAVDSDHLPIATTLTITP